MRLVDHDDEVYGVRTVTKQPRREGVVVGRDQVRRLMAEHGIVGVVRGKPRRTPADPSALRASDLVKRHFVASESNYDEGRSWLASSTVA